MTEPQANAASVALVRDGRVLLIQRARAPFAELWTLPGGRLEAGETAAEAAGREVAEELRIGVAALVPLTAFAAAPGWWLAVFATAHFTGEPLASPEVADWRWASMDEAARLPTTPGLLPILELALQRCAASA